MLQMLWLIIMERNSLQEIMIMIITVPKISLVLGAMKLLYFKSQWYL